MNTPAFTPERSDAFRSALIDHVAATRPQRRRRGLWAASLILIGALSGAGVSAAAFAATGVLNPDYPAGQPVPEMPGAVTAPAGTLPGAPLISLLGTPTSARFTEAAELPLNDRPAAATHLRVTLSPLTAGEVAWGTDASGNDPSSSFSTADVTSGIATTWYDFPLDDTVDTLQLTPSSGFAGIVTLQYVNYVPTRLAVNANGETYGVEGGPDGVPDLIAVTTTTGQEGYARATDLNAFSPDHPGQPSTPDEAVTWQAERDQKYPNGWDIPVYNSDGTTTIGSHHVG